MPDLLVKLYDLKENDYENCLQDKGISIHKAHIADKSRILAFVRTNFNENWANECEYALVSNPIYCYIAVKNKEPIGFACYDASSKNFFGPLGVKETERHHGVGKVLLHKCLESMKESGYAYAIIGWVEDALEFYKKEVDAIVIEDSPPNKSGYKNLINMD